MIAFTYPFQPIVDVDGANLLLSATESTGTSDCKSTILRVNTKLDTESFFFNASPSTIVALFGIVSSLDPFLEWAKGEKDTREQERLRLETQNELEAEEYVKYQREVLLKIFKEVDVDGSGNLSEEELGSVVRKLFDENSRGAKANQNINLGRPTADELRRERDYLLSIIDANRTNEVSFEEVRVDA